MRKRLLTPPYQQGFRLLTLMMLLIACTTEEQQPPGFMPEVLDDRLQLELLATSPVVMTPIGLTIDSQDQLYFLESHTHMPPSDYTGPAFDRIKKGVDENQDGIPESWIVFADSIEDGMNLAAGPDDVIYLVEKDKIKSFQDTDQDGVSDRMQTLLHMETPKGVYDHAGLLGITYSPDGWLYISRGNCGSSYWKIEGTDGSLIEGYGDGGNVFRCRPDGSEVEEIATDFWNPFDLKFSQQGRLMLVDNDPDSRGPNRLLDIVPGGDYGYESLYGGSGIHPFLAWNGELPGTLPYAAALGEAPSGLIDASFTNFPTAYKNNILATIWEENNIVRVPLETYQSSVRGEAEVILQGDSTFHPVALATNSKGDLYITDWVVRQYPNHGEGRIWRLTSGRKEPMYTSHTQAVAYEEQEETSFFSLGERFSSFDQHLEALQSGDVFLQTVARHSLSKDAAYHQDVLALSEHPDPEMRLQALLTLSESSEALSKARLKTLLQDKEEDIRRMALIYIASHLREDLLPDVKQALHNGRITPALFETYLSTIRHLQPDFISSYKAKSEAEAKQIKRELPPAYLMSIVSDNRLPAEIRAAALPYLENTEENKAELLAMLKNAVPPVQMGLLQALKQIHDQEVAEAMLNIALNATAEPALRTQALISLSYQSASYCKEVEGLLKEEDEYLLETAVRYLCRCDDEALSEEMDQQIEKSAHQHPNHLQKIWQLCQGTLTAEDRPSSDEEWEEAVDGTGDPEKGKLIFQLSGTQCQRCHKVDGWGGDFGPDLSNIGSSKNKEQLISAILEPSAEMSPEWQGWYVTDQEGQTHYGRQIDLGGNSAELLMPSGEFVTFESPRSYGVASTSLMPEGLENTLTKAEFNHLIAYLMSLQ